MKRTTRHIKGNDKKYGLEAVSRDPKTGDVAGIRCRFCVAFGRDPKVGQKRKPATTVHSWLAPFRYDNIENHLRSQHAVRWAQYSALKTDEEQDAFFASVAEPVKNTLHAHFVSESQSEREMVFTFNAEVVDRLIGELLYTPEAADGSDGSDSDETEPRTVENEARALDQSRQFEADRARRIALSIFKKHEGTGEGETTCYTATIPRSKVTLFKLTVRYVSCGASFRLASNLMEETYEVLKNPLLRACTPGTVSKFVRVVCAVNLQRISDLLENCWAFSLATDAATHQSTSYLDVRIRFYNAQIHNIVNVHALALPIVDRHTGAVMFEMLSSMLDVICADWRTKLIGVSTDGARNMTGKTSGLLTRISGSITAPNELIRVWCGAHQLDLVMEHILNDVMKERFFVAATTFITYLGRQQTLIAEMESTCPRIVNRWLSTEKVFSWFKRQRPRLLQHINAKRPESAPPPIWWVYLLAMETFTSHSAKTFRSIQGLTTLISQQHAELTLLVSNLMEEVGGLGPLSEVGLRELNPALHVSSGKFAVPLAKVEDFLVGLASWVEALLDETEPGDKNDLLVDVGTVFAVACDRITAICAERNSVNGPMQSDALPPVLPHELVQISAAKFLQLMRKQTNRLENKYSAEHIDVIADQHKSLLRAYRRDEVLRTGIDSCDGRTSFDSAWKLLAPQYPDLVDYCGGIATVFPGTATVESDFSILRWEKDSFRKSLSNFGLEGVMQAKQYFLLESLSSGC